MSLVHDEEMKEDKAGFFVLTADVTSIRFLVIFLKSS